MLKATHTSLHDSSIELAAISNLEDISPLNLDALDTRPDPDNWIPHTDTQFAYFPTHSLESSTSASLRHDREAIQVNMSQQPAATSGSRKISFNVSDQYDIQDVIGEGAYGVVW